MADSLECVTRDVVRCRSCPRLVAWREEVARDKRAAYADETYWGKPVPSFGDPDARVLVVGLAPAAHGGNRTGRIFTGDRSGDFLFGSLHRVGFANQATSQHRDDGLRLTDLYIAAAVRCAPPANKPTPEERDTCRPYLVRELHLLRRLRVVVVLGAFAYDALWATLRDAQVELPRRRARFAHLMEQPAGRLDGSPGTAGELTVLGSFHPSQQNTFTGKLTTPMLDAVFQRAKTIVSATK
jgi:uracil-DNA glycosylase family 4